MEIKIRETVAGDAFYLDEFLRSDIFGLSFPLIGDDKEREEAVSRWIFFAKYGSSITAEVDGHVAGIATLFVQHQKRVCHNSELGICVGESFRNKGVGTKLMSSLLDLAKNKMGLYSVHLFVSETNPAINLYKRMGFVEVGFHRNWAKFSDGKMIGRILMDLVL